LLNPAIDILGMILRYRRILVSVTHVELAKRYSGSAFGMAWLALYPTLLLGIYLFVFLVIFKMRFPGYSEMDYVLFVFAGLIPYIGLSEALTAGCLSIKQNIHLVKNVMLPIELIPIRTVTVSMASQIVAISILIALVAINGELSWRVVGLPIALLLQMMFLIGLVFVLAALAVALTDVSYFVNLAVMLMMFISPIGFKPEMVPSGFSFMIYLNPVHYMAEAYRTALIASHPANPTALALYAIIACTVFALGCAFFRRFKGILVDYE